jgi:hypothetical protein
MLLVAPELKRKPARCARVSDIPAVSFPRFYHRGLRFFGTPSRRGDAISTTTAAADRLRFADGLREEAEGSVASLRGYRGHAEL